MSIIPILFGSKAKTQEPFSLDGWKAKTQEPFSLDGWNPMDVSSFSSLITFSGGGPKVDSVQVDWKETPTSHVFKADLPGLKKDEVKVEVEEKRYLKIRGERSKEVDEKDDKWHRVGRSFGKFLGSIQLPEDATVGGAKAVLENGVLTVTVPKEKDKKQQARVIEIEG
uniref:18. class I heat shock protein n=1 Tax=Anthurium amnicola TaxID=1678845 RepID=A0A1D1XY91_9ARAE